MLFSSLTVQGPHSAVRAMEAAGFSDLREQRRDNALLLAALHHALAQVEGDRPDTGRDALAALPDLLSLHRICGLLAQRRVRAAGPVRPGCPRERAR